MFHNNDLISQWKRTNRGFQDKAAAVGSGVVILAALLVPLCFNPWGYSAFELPKVLLLRIIAALALTAILSIYPDWLTGIGQRLKRNPWLGPLLAYSSALFLATLLSPNRFLSFWGLYERQQGLLTQLTYVVIFLAAVVTQQGIAGQRRLWLALVWGSLPVVGYGLAQVTGHDPFTWQIDELSPWLSTLGRTNFLGSYLVLVMPLTLAAWFSQLRAGNRKGQIIGLLLLAQAVCLASTQVRAAWIGLAVSAGVAILLIALLDQRHRLLLGLLCGGGLVSLTLLILLYLASQSMLPAPLSRLQGLLDLRSGSVAARLSIWRAALALWTERPLLGYGPETFAVHFPQVFPAELVYYQGCDVTIDRAHNLWLDLAASTGLAGVVTFAWLCLTWVRLVWRDVRATQIGPSKAVGIAVIAAAAGHLADMQFSFETSATAAVFWLILALGLARNRREWPHPSEAVKRPYSPPITLAVTTLVIGMLSLFAIHQTQADMALWQAIQTNRPLALRLWQAS